MSKLVIVAIPRENDYVWRISSEKVPHCTLLFLGETESTPNVLAIEDFLGHAARTTLTPFGLSVDRRGTLGEDKADVLLFSEYGVPKLHEFRAALLQNDAISQAYASVPQFPEWHPHLTLGYPKSPAKPDLRDYPGIDWVSFDRVALWTDDFEGTEFVLVHNDSFMEMAMSNITHHGVKGMRWGVRRANSGSGSSSEVTVRALPGKPVKVKGGTGHAPHPDAIAARIAGQKVKKSGPDSLSNREMSDLVNRLNLESQLSRLSGSTPGNTAIKTVADILAQVGKQQLSRLANDVATKQIENLLVKGGKK